nr:MAG TPA: hypothetical protein [Bacteriophage sp.]
MGGSPSCFCMLLVAFLSFLFCPPNTFNDIPF